MRPLSGRARAAGIAAMALGLVGSSLVGAGAFAVDSPSAAACPDGSMLYRPPGTPANPAGTHSTTKTDSTTTTESSETTPGGGVRNVTTTVRTITETTVLGPPSGSPEAETDPFVAPGAPDPDSFLCVDEGRIVPAIGSGPLVPTASPDPTPQPTLLPAPQSTPQPAVPSPPPDPALPTPLPLPGTSSPNAPYPPDGGATDDGTDAGYDPETPGGAPSPTPVAEPPLQPAPGMVAMPAGGAAAPPAVPPGAPTEAPSPTPGGTPPDGPSDPGPGDNPAGGGTVVRPGPVDGGPLDTSGSITRDQVIARAVSWVLQGVPYSQTSWWTDKNGTYRQDCSGYVSMAWNLNQRTNYWTGNLANVSHRIATKNLKMGDILLLPRSHVVIFAGWANSERTKFHLFEEYSRGKPARYLTGANLSYYLGRGYGAYRYDKIADVKAGRAGSQSTVYLSSFSGDAELPELTLEETGIPHNQLSPVAWSEQLAAENDSEEYAPSAVVGAVTPDAVPELPLETLVDAQLATDQRASDELSESSGIGTTLIAAGLGLLFLAFPLAGAARAGAWTRHYGLAEEQ